MATKREKPSKSTRALARRPIVQVPLAQLPTPAGDRRALGRSRTVEALFPAPPPKLELPSGYAKVLGELKQRIEQTRLATVITANTAMTRLYWHVGRVILARQEREGWGAKVIDRLSYDLRQAFPDMSGLSARNLKYMRAFASAWTDREIVQAPLAQLTWYHHLALIEKLDDKAVRLWYAKRAVEHGWSRNILAFQIAGRLHAREGKALNNFKQALPPGIPISPRRCSRIRTYSTSSAPLTHARSTRSRRHWSRMSSASCWSSDRDSRSLDAKFSWKSAATTSSSTCSSITSSFGASSSSS